MVHQRYEGRDSRIVNAYSARTDAATGVITRTYLDGHKEEVGKTFSRVEFPGRYIATRHTDGLREATGADGRRLFVDRWQSRRVNGVDKREMVRTVYSETINNQAVDYAQPFERTYAVQKYFGVLAFAYQPALVETTFYAPFSQNFAQPVLVAPDCLICPAPVVAFERPVEEYSDPMSLVGDLAISSAVSDPVEAPVLNGDATAAVPNADVDYLTQQVADLQQQVDDAKAQNEALSQQLDSAQGEPTAEPSRADPEGRRRPPSAPVQTQTPTQPTLQPAVAYVVSEPVRKQIHAQVRENVRLHQANQALTWPALISSGQSRKFIFQVSDTIATVDTNGQDCALTGGDMLKLDDGAAPDDPSLRMQVVISKPASCAAKAIVNVSVADAQNMLNDFSTRQENIMKQVHTKLTGTTRT